MRIDRVVVHRVSWPLKMKRSHGIGPIETRLSGVILELHTDDGRIMLPAKDIAGIAAAAGMPNYGGTVFEGGIVKRGAVETLA